MKKYFLILFFATNLFSQIGPWLNSGRTHPELKWFTIETKNFKIHYHNGIEEIANKGAKIAEFVWPTLLKQLQIDSLPKIDITLTSEDEILNGYASWTNSVFIWVDQNDTPVWLEDEKWLYQVISHELQHIVLLNAIQSWIPEPFGILFSDVPGWFIEGSAEYFTEKWRPGRADLSHKIHILKNQMDKMDPHNDGFSKLLYLSSRFGDSSIVKIVKWRDESLKIYNFSEAFLKVTGIPLNRFEEEWRLQMNTYYFGVRAQKETYEEVGKILTLPIKNVSTFKFSEDSLKIAAIGKLKKLQFDESLILAIEDTSKKRNMFSFFKSKKIDSVKQKNYKTEEIDFGNFHSFDFSNNSEKLVYSKYHFANKQEMVWDLKLYDLKTKNNFWITNSMRATFPTFSNDNKFICFVAHKNNISNLYLYNLESKKIEQLTNFNFDIQINSPEFSPDDEKIVYSASREDGNMNIELIDLSSKEIKILTNNPEAEYLPIWTQDGIVFTSHKNGTPNIFTIDLDSNFQKQRTDIGDALFGLQLAPKSKNIFALTLQNVDTIRFVEINPNREITTEKLSLRNSFSSWKNKTPDLTLSPPKNDFSIDIISNKKYNVFENIKHLSSFGFPYLDGSGVFGFSSWTDGMGRNILAVGGSLEKNKGGVYLSLINGSFWPILNFEYFENFRSSYRIYDKNELFEYLNGITISGIVNYNFGNSMSSSHIFNLNYNLQNRLVEYNNKNASKDLNVPENAKDEFLKFQYIFYDTRFFSSDPMIQEKKIGVKLSIQKSFKLIFGNFNYSKLSFDGFSILPFGPVGFYSRFKIEGLDGVAPKQDYIGITRDLPIYFPGSEGILNFPENYSLRGIDTLKFGNRFFLGTIELRLPLIKSFPINFFGLSIGSIGIAAISDFGNTWFVGNKEKFNLLSTFGYETKFALQILHDSILNFAYGEAQSISDWNNNKNNLKKYLRMSLITPF